MPDFIPGLRLGEIFYQEAVAPVLAAHFPDLRYAAALIGHGSEILGFDTEMSSDHHWGPRLMLFLTDTDYDPYAESIRETLRHHLPYSVAGYPTHWSTPDPDDNGVQHPRLIHEGPVNHRVEVFTVRGYCEHYLGVDPRDGMAAADWLTLPGQKLRTMIGGQVYHDSVGELTHVRDLLAYYPHDLWLYLLAAGWTRIAQEEAFMGRTGIVGDEVGSRVVAARLVHDLMNLVFLMQRVYPPYSKWFGTAFARLDDVEELTRLFHAVFDAQTWQERETPLTTAYGIVAEMHNALDITQSIPAQVLRYHGRPFLVIHGDVFADALLARIQDADVKRIAERTMIGSVEQFSTSTDFLENVRLCRQARMLYA